MGIDKGHSFGGEEVAGLTHAFGNSISKTRLLGVVQLVRMSLEYELRRLAIDPRLCLQQTLSVPDLALRQNELTFSCLIPSLMWSTPASSASTIP